MRLRLFGAGERTEKGKLILEAIEESYGHKERPHLEDLTVEHVMPQTLTQDWMDELGPQYKEVHDGWLHTIGNLTLTAYNPELSNAKFQRKCEILTVSNLELNKYFKDCKTWNEEDIQARTSVLTTKCLELWPYFGKGSAHSSESAGPIDLDESDADEQSYKKTRTPTDALEAKRAQLVAAMSAKLSASLNNAGSKLVADVVADSINVFWSKSFDGAVK